MAQSARGNRVSVANRRTILKASAGAVAGTGSASLGWRFVQAQDAGAATTDPTGTPIACGLTPELTEGPYLLAGDLIRQDITEGRQGVPLKLRIGVINPNTCSDVENVAVDIWRCDALGYYSGVAGNQPVAGEPISEDLDEIAGDNFLRGIQITDAEGTVEFDTIYPGWFRGRAIHIHLLVHVGGTPDDSTETYEGGHVAHTGQLYFDEATNEILFKEPPYSELVTPRLANADDRILGSHAEEPGFMLDLSLIKEESLADGLLGVITLGVNPDLTPAAEGTA